VTIGVEDIVVMEDVVCDYESVELEIFLAFEDEM
jgi:hypothetical protein